MFCMLIYICVGSVGNLLFWMMAFNEVVSVEVIFTIVFVVFGARSLLWCLVCKVNGSGEGAMHVYIAQPLMIFMLKLMFCCISNHLSKGRGGDYVYEVDKVMDVGMVYFIECG